MFLDISIYITIYFLLFTKLIIKFPIINIEKKDYNRINNIKYNLFIILQQFLIILFLLIFYKAFKNRILYDNFKIILNGKNIKLQNLNYDNYKFAIIKCKKCSHCGFFCLFKFYLYSLTLYLNKGYIPIIDLASFPNIYNGFNKFTKINPWEFFFNQPFGYTLELVLKNAKNIKYFECYFPKDNINHTTFYNNTYFIEFYHEMAIKYIPLKNEIIKEVNMIRKNLFNNANNVLGILQRGTDYIAIKPRFHPIPPKNKDIIYDIKLMDKKNKYDYYFLSTEDDIIRKEFINEFKSKLKFIKPEKKIQYNYKSKGILAFNKNVKGDINFVKIYLINIIILSKCLDIICARTNGTIGLFILSNGFRNTKIYFLGEYK